MVSLSRPLPFRQSQGWQTEGQLAQTVLLKCEHMNYTKYILMMGNIEHIANFDVKIQNIYEIYFL